MDHALVLIGASAGGVEALRDVVTALSADLNASATHPSPAPAASGTDTIHLEEPDGPPAPFTCPRCHGPLWETDRGLTGAARHHRQHAAELRDNAETIRGTLGTLSGSTVSQEHGR